MLSPATLTCRRYFDIEAVLLTALDVGLRGKVESVGT